MVEDVIPETNRTKESRSLSNLIYQGEVIFDNYTKDDTIKQGLIDVGYTEEKMNAGLALLNELKLLENVKTLKFGDQIGSTVSLNVAFDSFYDEFMQDFKIANVCFRNNSRARTILGLDKRRRDAFDKAIKQMASFYDGLLDAEILPLITKYGITQEKIVERKAGLEAVKSLDHVQEEKKGDSRVATKNKNDVLEEYRVWLRDIKALIKAKFGRDSPLIEKLRV